MSDQAPLNDQDAPASASVPAPVPTTEFLITKEYRRFAEFCDACRRDRYIGLCYGPPGVGKTLSARHYARWDLIEATGARYMRETGPPAEISNCRTVFYTATVANTPRVIDQEVRGARRTLDSLLEEINMLQRGQEDYPFSWNPPELTELIIVDEADRLKMAGLEQMRDIYDRSQANVGVGVGGVGIGLILIGMPGLEKRLARYPQLYSRVGFVHQFHPLSTEELRFILEHKWQQLGLVFSPDDFTDAEAMAAIVRITGGNFRLVQRLFSQIERILQINALHLVTKEVVEAARENLVIGSH